MEVHSWRITRFLAPSLLVSKQTRGAEKMAHRHTAGARRGRQGSLTPRAGHGDAHGPPAHLSTMERSCFLWFALKQLPKLRKSTLGFRGLPFCLVAMPYIQKDCSSISSSASIFPCWRSLTVEFALMVKAMRHSIIWPFSSSVTSFLECRGHNNRNHSGFHFEELFTGTRAPFMHSSPWSASLWSAQGHTQCQQ